MGYLLPDSHRTIGVMQDWSAREARNQLGAVVDAAVSGEPQRVTRRGKPAVVVIAAEEYERLRRVEKAKVPTFAELLLAIPQDGGEFERRGLGRRPAPKR